MFDSRKYVLLMSTLMDDLRFNFKTPIIQRFRPVLAQWLGWSARVRPTKSDTECYGGIYLIRSAPKVWLVKRISCLFITSEVGNEFHPDSRICCVRCGD